jgi:hypothetical protein
VCLRLARRERAGAGRPRHRADPSGLFFGMDTFVGALVGAAAGFGGGVISGALSGHINWGDVGRDTLVGGAVGAAVTLCGPCAEGVGAVVGNVVAGAVGASAQDAWNQYADNGQVSWGEVGAEAFVGGLTSAIPWLGAADGIAAGGEESETAVALGGRPVHGRIRPGGAHRGEHDRAAEDVGDVRWSVLRGERMRSVVAVDPSAVGESPDTLSVAPSPRRILALGVPVCFACLLPPLLVADMTAGGRWGWIGVSAAFALLAYAASRNRLTVRGAVLIQRGAVLSASFRLDRLAGVRVFRATGYSNRPWQMTLTDTEGRRMQLRLNGYEVRDRRRLMALIEPYARRPEVRLSGPIDEALAGGLWFPHLPRPTGNDSWS